MRAWGFLNMAAADIILIILGAATLVTVLVGLGVQLRSYYRDQAEREALRIVHLHLDPDETNDFVADVLLATPAGFTKCRQPVSRVTSHPAVVVAKPTRPSGNVLESGFSEVDERDRCPECWKPAVIVGP